MGIRKLHDSHRNGRAKTALAAPTRQGRAVPSGSFSGFKLISCHLPCQRLHKRENAQSALWTSSRTCVFFKSNRREVAGPTARLENIPSSTGALGENPTRARRERVYFSAALQPFAEKLQRATSPLKISRSSAGVLGENSTGACVFLQQPCSLENT